MVRKDSPFDDDSREAAYALWQDERERCPDCGQPRSICSDPSVDYFPQRAICWATAALRVAQRRWDRHTEDAQPDASGYLPGDGVTVWVSTTDLEPDNDWLTGTASQQAQEGGD